jgi:hypothetical protein
MAKAGNPTLRDLNRAIQRYARLQMVFQRRVWSNHHRTDVTALVMTTERKYVAVPVDPVQYERIGMAQHRLHVKVHEAGKEVERIAAALGRRL